MNDGLGEIIELAELQRKGKRPPRSVGDDRPSIKILAGQLPRVLDEAEAALVAWDKNLYRYGGRLVSVVWDEIRVSGHGEKDGGKERSLRLATVTAAALLERFERAAQFEKFNEKARGFVPCNCPTGLAERYLGRGNWRVPVLLGVVTAPTLRADRTILDRPGYDPESGLVFEPLGVEFPPIPQQPSKQEAAAALAKLKGLLATFPFVNETSRSVALSGILTTVARRAMEAAPMHGFDAPVAGSGKSKLGDLAAVIATGHRAAAVAIGRESRGEFEKALATSILGGDTVILLDNMFDPVGGQLLCQMLTQHAVRIRIFGKLENATVPSGAMVFCNGNNLVIDGDATRRTIVGRLNAGCERPELREFDFDPVQRAGAQRPELLVAALTVLRAWSIHRGDEKMPVPLGSFEQWSRLVRNALIWLGEADPVESMEEVRAADPQLKLMRDMMTAWARVFNIDTAVAVRELIAGALQEHESKKDGEPIKVRTNPDLHEAIRAIAEGKEDWNKAIGRWLLRNKDRVISISVDEPGRDGPIETTVRCTFTQLPDMKQHSWQWMLVNVDNPIVEVEATTPW